MQGGELIPIGDALSGMGGPVQAIREASPPARRGFTLADQVNQLVSASEADPDLVFMARLMALCSLPRSNPGNRPCCMDHPARMPYHRVFQHWG